MEDDTRVYFVSRLQGGCVFRSFYPITFYLCVSFYSMSSWCCIMGKNEYRKFGVLYVIIGFWFFFYFNFVFTDVHLLTSVWHFFPSGSYILVSFLFMFTFFGSVGLMLFGVVLLVRRVKWLFIVSEVLSLILSLCYLFISYYPIVVFFSNR